MKCSVCKEGEAKEVFKKYGNYCSKTCTNKGERAKKGEK